MSWVIPKIWEGGDVWILGGGPSVPDQFGVPNEVIQSVIKKVSSPSVYSPYMSCIHDKHVIGINVAFMIGDWIDIIFFGDENFFKENRALLAKFRGVKVSCSKELEKCKWVKYTPKDSKHRHGISPRSDAVSWNGNSGAAAISLAVHAGAKRIILLGFDMHLEQGKQHWHNHYGKGIIDPNQRRLPFKKHLKGFPQIAADAKRMGVEIINASPNSAIKDFPKVTVKELCGST